MPLGERLKSQREEHRMTLEEVAKHVGVSRQTVFKYENGIITNIPSDKIAAMARLFNVSPAYLMCWTDDPSDEGEQRTPIVIKDFGTFKIIMENMSVADYEMVMDAFYRTGKKLREEGKL